LDVEDALAAMRGSARADHNDQQRMVGANRNQISASALKCKPCTRTEMEAVPPNGNKWLRDAGALPAFLD
jgi:hypothetical protein